MKRVLERIHNDTAYGPGLEFWDLDADSDGTDDASSYSNGRICGKLLYLKDTKGWTWWQTRYVARMTASGAGTRTDADGYGKIDVTAALAWLGTVTDDPYTDDVEDSFAVKRDSAEPTVIRPRINILKQRGMPLFGYRRG
jgi:hypothetical protein